MNSERQLTFFFFFWFFSFSSFNFSSLFFFFPLFSSFGRPVRPDRPLRPDRPFLSTKLVSTSGKKKGKEQREHGRGWAGPPSIQLWPEPIDRALSISLQLLALSSTRLRLPRRALREELDSVSRTGSERLIVKKRRGEKMSSES